MNNKNKTRKKRYLNFPMNVNRIKKQKKPVPYVYSEEMISYINNRAKTLVYKLTDEEKKNISDELEELLNNPNVSINDSSKEVIKNSFVSYKSLYISENMELNWYKIAQHYIKVLKSKIKNIEKVR